MPGAGFAVSGEQTNVTDNSTVLPDVGGVITPTPFNVTDQTSLLGWNIGTYIQDEWRLTNQLTLNMGLRFDQLYQFVDANQLSPRFAIVYKPVDGTTFHAGYARYFTPPPFELIASESVAKFVAENPAKLKADVALVSDTQLYAEGLPTLCIGLRGLVYMELEAIGPDRDLHSGLYGGAAPNPIHGLMELLCKCKDATGSIRIPGMYDDVAPPASVERESWKQLPFDESVFLRKEVGATELIGEAGYSVLERVWARPTMEVHGIAGGFTGPGSKTVIPSKAVAKISFRLVPNQDPDKIIKSFRDFIQFNAPSGVRMQLRVLGAAPAVMVDPDHPAIRIAARAFSDMLGQPTVLTRNGGSIPVVGDFATHLRVPTILMGFGLPDDGLHSPNEKYRLGNYYTGIMTIAHFFEQYGAAEPRP